MKLCTALVGTAALLLLLPLAVVQAIGPVPGIDRELDEAVQDLQGLHLAGNRFPSVNRSPGIIGDGRNRLNPSIQASRDLGAIGNHTPRRSRSGRAGFSSETAGYSHGASPYGQEYHPDPAGSTSYFTSQPGNQPTSSNVAHSYYPDAQPFVDRPLHLSSSRDLGFIGNSRGKRILSHKQSGSTSFSSGPAGYSHGASPYGQEYQPYLTGPTSYFTSQPKFTPFSRNHHDSQALAHPDSYGVGPSQSFHYDQHSRHAVPNDNEAFNAASPRSSPSSLPPSHPSWGNAQAVAYASDYDRIDDEVKLLLAGSNDERYPSYEPNPGRNVDRHLTDTTHWSEKLSDKHKKTVRKIAKQIAEQKAANKFEASYFFDLGNRFLSGYSLSNDKTKTLSYYLKSVQAEAQLWAALFEALLSNKVYNFGPEDARAVLATLSPQVQDGVFFSATQVNLSYRIRLQMEYDTWIMKNSGMRLGKNLFKLKLDKSRQVAALAWYFIEAGERATDYEGVSWNEKEQLKHAMMARQQPR